MDQTTAFVAELIARGLLQIANIHGMHFATSSYAAHKALGDYYSDLEDLIDTIAESAIGNGFNPEEILGKSIAFSFDSPENAVSSIKEFNQFIDSFEDHLESLEENEEEGGEEGVDWCFMQNLLDELTTLNNQTIYKLTRFK